MKVKIILQLLMFYPMESLKKALADSNHSSNISWPYKSRLFFRILRVHCQIEFSKMHAICWPAILEVRRNNKMFLYFYALLPYFSQSGQKYPEKEVGFCAEPRKKVAYFRSWQQCQSRCQTKKTNLKGKKTVKKNKFICLGRLELTRSRTWGRRSHNSSSS